MLLFSLGSWAPGAEKIKCCDKDPAVLHTWDSGVRSRQVLCLFPWGEPSHTQFPGPSGLPLLLTPHSYQGGKGKPPGLGSGLAGSPQMHLPTLQAFK